MNDEKEESSTSTEYLDSKEVIIKKEDGVTCPICFGEYTSSGDHRMASMKCGHLFGHSCILDWFAKKKFALCPICAVKSSKSQLRLIFSSRVVALNTEKEHKLIEQYLTEFNAKNKLLHEVAALKAEIEILRLNNKTGCECMEKKKELAKPISFYTKIKCTLPTKGGIVLFDDVNGLILLSAVKEGKPCIMKFYDSGMTSTKIYNEPGTISHMKYIDGNIFFSIGSKFYIVNSFNSNIIHETSTQYKITALEGSAKNRNKLIIGDDRGNITLHLIGVNRRIIKICNVPIHSIYEVEGAIYIGTVFNVYKLKIDMDWEDFISSEESPEIKIVNLNLQNMVCINIFGEDNVVVLVFRNKINKILHYHIDETQEKAINIGLRQISKFKEILCGGNYYLVDQCENKIVAVNSNHEKKGEYQANENIVSFDVKIGFLVLLSEDFLYVYK